MDCYHDGEAALVGLARRPASLGVFDIKMPRLDGIELLQKVRGQSQMPVIFLTSKDDELDEALGLGMGADDYIISRFLNACCSPAFAQFSDVLLAGY